MFKFFPYPKILLVHYVLALKWWVKLFSWNRLQVADLQIWKLELLRCPEHCGGVPGRHSHGINMHSDMWDLQISEWLYAKKYYRRLFWAHFEGLTKSK